MCVKTNCLQQLIFASRIVRRHLALAFWKFSEVLVAFCVYMACFQAFVVIFCSANDIVEFKDILYRGSNFLIMSCPSSFDPSIRGIWKKDLLKR